MNNLKMVKFVTSILLILSMSTVLASTLLHTTINATSLDYQTIFKHNGITFQTGAFDYNNRIYVPLREIGNKFGYSIKWNPDDRTVVIADMKRYSQFQLDSKFIYQYGGNTIQMDVTPLIVDGTLFIPIRWAVEPLGKIVSYKEIKKKVNGKLTKVRIIDIQDTIAEIW